MGEVLVVRRWLRTRKCARWRKVKEAVATVAILWMESDRQAR